MYVHVYIYIYIYVEREVFTLGVAFCIGTIPGQQSEDYPRAHLAPPLRAVAPAALRRYR